MRIYKLYSFLGKSNSVFIVYMLRRAQFGCLAQRLKEGAGACIKREEYRWVKERSSPWKMKRHEDLMIFRLKYTNWRSITAETNAQSIQRLPERGDFFCHSVCLTQPECSKKNGKLESSKQLVFSRLALAIRTAWDFPLKRFDYRARKSPSTLSVQPSFSIGSGLRYSWC